MNEIADLKSCNQIIYLETRKHQDLYMYLSQSPHGPSVKFHVVNVHTMDELKLTGNCMVGSRPLLNFDSKFNQSEHWKLMKNLLLDAFNTPMGHPKSKPFVDHIMSFFIVKNNICKLVYNYHVILSLINFINLSLYCQGIRNYQIVNKSERIGTSDSKDTHLVEIGPRMVLVPIRIFSNSLSGATLYQNQAFITPNEERSSLKRNKGYVLLHYDYISLSCS